MDNAVPTDSVLRRHYEATHTKTRQNQPSQVKKATTSSGLIHWLKKIFGV